MKILIIGGVAGGATAAARLRRLDESAEIIVFEKGPYVSFANCGLPYYVGGVIEDQENILLQNPESFFNRYRVDVRVNNEVLAIDKNQKTVEVKNLQTEKTYTENYDKLILSPGAKVLLPNIEGLGSRSVFKLKTVDDSENLKDYIKKNNPRTALVVGGGYIGLETAENLKHIGLEVIVLEMASQLVAPLDYEMAAEVHQHLETKGVKLYLGEQLIAVKEETDNLKAVLKSGVEIETDLIVVAIGISPETELAKKAGLKIGESGGIFVDKYMQTSDKHIYAVGDAAEIWDPILKLKRVVPLAGPANKQARIASDNIVLGNKETYRGSVATSIAKVFDITVGVTGYSEKVLQKKNIDYNTAIVHVASHAGYYPGSYPLSIKLNFSPKDGLVYGAQAVGYDGADKAIESFSLACQFGLTVFELKDMDQAYAPPYSSAKSPVNMAAFVAENIIKGKQKTISAQEFSKIDISDSYILDVRNPEEFMLGNIKGSVNIPLNSLRERLLEIPKDTKIYVYCAVGLRAYIASRILLQKGYVDVYNLTGGFKTWERATMKHIRSNDKAIYTIDKDDAIYKTPASAAVNLPPSEEIVKIDARGLQCPGPIMKLNNEMKALPEGTVLEINATDPGFSNDVDSWCRVTGNNILKKTIENKEIQVLIKKGLPKSVEKGLPSNDKTLVVFSDDLDKAIAAFIIANGALAMGRKVTMFFTFWGLNILKKPKAPKVKKDIISKMFAKLMPTGVSDLKLSKMNFMGFGPKMIKSVMESKNIDTLTELMSQATEKGLRIIACQMSMDVMGISKKELIDNIEISGVASYIEAAESSDTNLFI